MTLDNNTEQFSDAIRAASEHLSIAPIHPPKMGISVCFGHAPTYGLRFMVKD